MVALKLKPKMEKDFEPGDSANLPRVDCFTAVRYLASMKLVKLDRNKSPKPCTGDDSIGYVQLHRNEGLCTLKARVNLSPEAYGNVTLIINEVDEEVMHIECHDCDEQNECWHGAVFLLWLHRRSEEPDFPYRESYWREPKIAQVESRLKIITTKQLSKTKRRLPELQSNPAVLTHFLSEAKKRNLDGTLIRYLSTKEDDDKS
ncbi:hypothetical protein PYW07_011191 [Mythimna separata]|uniref:Uncharacterized protein n=1 Tax=Mythimna separata TaxID=271217 RepID=A0AAD7Y7V9_MYTSE|nr:hypothetical protein PYW07_011191 [Mythimna separata]